MAQDDDAVVAPEHLLTHEEGRDPERSTSARLFRRRGREPGRLRLGKPGDERASREPHRLGYSHADRFGNGPDIGAVDRSAEPPAVRRREAQAPRCRRGADEKLEIEVVGRGLAKRNSVVVRPALCVVAAVRPIVLSRNRLPGEGIATPEPSDLGPVHRPPIDTASGVRLEGRHLARREIRVAAAGREEEVDGHSIFHHVRQTVPGGNSASVRGGRLDFGVGIGWLREEFEALGVPFAGRAARCREYLAAMRSLWTDPVSRYEGRLLRIPPLRMFPKPIQKPHPPIIFGGESDAALRRVADLGQGWYGFSLLPDEAAPRIAVLDGMLAERGRAPASVEVSVSPYFKPARDAAALRAYAEAGVDQVIYLVGLRGPDTVAAEIEALATELIPTSDRLGLPARRRA